jgi:hypothetical protein
MVPELVTHLKAHDLSIGYDEAQHDLRDETAWNSGRMTDFREPAFVHKADLYLQFLDHL